MRGRAGLVTGGDGLSYHVAEGLEALEAADTIFVPGYRTPAATDPPAVVVDALKAAHARGARLAAISTGAFALAATGLLDGRRATTHWHYTKALRGAASARCGWTRTCCSSTRAPCSPRPGRRPASTSACIWCGATTASGCPTTWPGGWWRRRTAAGGRPSTCPRSVPEPLGDLFAGTREWALAHLAEPLTLEVLARNARVSARTFSRRFAEDTGYTPMQWVLRARVDLARELLERSDLGVEQIAAPGRARHRGQPAPALPPDPRHVARRSTGTRSLRQPMIGVARSLRTVAKGGLILAHGAFEPLLSRRPPTMGDSMEHMTRIAINGFGRIGRNTLRALLERRQRPRRGRDQRPRPLRTPWPTCSSTTARSAASAARSRSTDDDLVVDGRRIRVLAEREPGQLPWAELGVDIVLEATGRFTAADAARAHLDAGARRVLVSAPSAGADVTLAYGVNTDAYDPARHVIISNASCTTNALAPLASVLDDLAGIEHGFMTTVHAYTQEQNLQDGPHRDLRRARAAAVNIAPDHDGRGQGDRPGAAEPGRQAVRRLDPGAGPGGLPGRAEHRRSTREVSRDEVLAAYRAAADGALKGILDYSDEPLVSSDITGQPASAIFDAALARVDGRHVKVVAWYDNEWGFSNRVIDTLELLARG